MDAVFLRNRYPWNKGALVGQKRPLQPKNVWSIRVRLEMSGAIRDLALFNLAIDSKLRACDLVKLRVEDLWSGSSIRDRATIIQKKTKRPVQFEVTEQTKTALVAWLPFIRRNGGSYLFPSRRKTSHHLSTTQCARIVHPGSRLSDLMRAPTEPTPCGEPRQRRFTRRQVTSGPSRFCSDIRSWKAPFAISASRWMTPLELPSRSSYRFLTIGDSRWSLSRRKRAERLVQCRC
jgi:hypothetical protein